VFGRRGKNNIERRCRKQAHFGFVLFQHNSFKKTIGPGLVWHLPQQAQARSAPGGMPQLGCGRDVILHPPLYNLVLKRP